MAFLSAINIIKKYGTYTALNDVSIELTEKSIFGLLGPNGAGKTSLIRILNQITGPDSGQILFEGQKLGPEHIVQFGYLPEERGLYKKMEVGEQVLYLARLKGMSKADAVKKLKFWFEKFEIQNWWNKKVEELSKGMQQKVQFICTVIHQPRLLILDEPFSGFDPINANLIKNEILNLKKEGSTIILSTHNMASVEELCDEIALIHKGEKILDGSVKEIRQKNASNTYEIQFTGNLIAFTNALWSGFELLDKQQDGKLCKVKVKLLNNATPNDIIASVLPHVQLQSFNEVIPTMNDIFIAHVNSEIPHNIASLTE